MKIRNLLGLAALGGGVYWMQKKRGGDMSFASIKDNAKGLVNDLMHKLNLQGESDQKSATDTSASAGTSSSSVGSSIGSQGSSYGTYTGSGSSYGGSAGGSSSGYGGSGYGGSGNFGGGNNRGPRH